MIFTVNCHSSWKIQINKFEWHSLLLLFNSDGYSVHDKYAFVLTWWCHLNNIISHNIFHQSMGQGITYLCFCCFFTFCAFIVCLFVWLFVYFFHRLIRLFSLGWRRWNEFYHLLNVSCFHISGCGKILNYNGLRQKRLTSLRWDLTSETYQAIPAFVSCIVFNQGCWVFIQYNLFEDWRKWILIQPWTQIVDYSLPGLT